MKIVLLIVYLLNGCFFLLVSTVLYPAISNTLLGNQAIMTATGFWSLQSLLKAIRILFIGAGIFLILYGTVMFLMRNRWNL